MALRRHACQPIDAAMPARDPKRDERLAAALRENLRKRKAQAREAKDETKPDLC